MFGIGLPELLIILFIVLIIFGASRLPEIGAGLGQGIKNFKKAFKEDKAIDVTPQKELEEKEKAEKET
ncbi:MAG: twin-arginine translocase TatA/TatE family subunit [Candidatus Desulfofervidaceae bacterium]|nr:twin-arginine translocase TatA/TatE family subunit [Candidatus Desulfofervidaceae bacterium]MDL1970588.1 twin-arginine translocase TatA/TatE family subunit [Candidatus Desulfofervidaceae bacterium]